MRINERKLHILELTICSNTPHGFEQARTRKLHKPSYCHLITDLETRGVEVTYTTLEIGSLGHYKLHAIKDLQSFFSNLSKVSASSILQKLARVSVGCSFNIFNARNSSTWATDRSYFT